MPSRPIGSNFFVRASPTPVPVWDLVAEYERLEPETALLHQVVREQLEGFRTSAVQPRGTVEPARRCFCFANPILGVSGRPSALLDRQAWWRPAGSDKLSLLDISAIRPQRRR